MVALILLAPVAWFEVGIDKFETQVIGCIITGDKESLAKLEQKWKVFTPAQKAKLGLRMRKKTIEFRIHGVFPGEAFFPGIMEYLVAPDGLKDHEVLVAVDKTEMKRVRAIGRMLKSLAERKKPPTVRYRYTWQKDGKLHSESVRDLIVDPQKKRKEFFEKLRFDDRGFSSFNIAVEPSLFGKKRVPAMLGVNIPR